MNLNLFFLNYFLKLFCFFKQKYYKNCHFNNFYTKLLLDIYFTTYNIIIYNKYRISFNFGKMITIEGEVKVKAGVVKDREGEVEGDVD